MLDSSNLKLGEEQFEEFKRVGKNFIQYDYRHTNGELFSCIAISLEVARNEKIKWVKGQDDENQRELEDEEDLEL